MKPVRTPYTNCTFKLSGGTDENDLPAEVTYDAERRRCIMSTWEPNEEERRLISEGRNIRLVVWASQPPVALAVEEE